MSFQVVAIPVLLLIAVATAVAVARRKITPKPGMLWVALWLTAAFSVAYPDVVVRAARSLGIGRGADLVVYVFIIFMLTVVFAIHLRFRRLDEQITRIVRHLAVTQPSDAARPSTDASRTNDGQVG